MSERDPATATMERDLHAIEEALDSGSTTHPDPDARVLQELALALRADAPAADPGFERDLRRRVDAGFPPQPGTVRGRVARARGAVASRPPGTLPGLALVATVLLALVLGVSVGGPAGDDDSGGGVAVDSGGGAAESGSSGGGGVVQQERVAPSTDRGFAPGNRDRAIERSISLELETPADELARVADEITAVTGRFGGFVLSSSLSTGDEGSGGDFELRVPTQRLQPALRELSALGTVRSQSQTGRDVTRERVTAQDRLQAARAQRAGLLTRLEQAATDEETEALRRQLDLVAGEINGLRAQLRDLRLRTDYAVVNVSLEPTSDGGDGTGGAGGSFDDALGDARDLLVGTAGVLIRVLAVGVPLALIALVVWAAARILRRRRRESVLA